MSKQTLTYCLLLMGVVIHAQISFKALVDKPEVKVGERFQLSFVITSSKDIKFSSMSLPNFKNFQVLGRNSGSNMSYAGGELTRQYIESVVLLAQKPGTYKIAPARVKWNGEEHLSNTLQIVVSEREDNYSSSASAQASVKMQLELSTNQAYPNQSILADVKLYAKSYDLLRRRSDIEVPGISGFQVTKLSQNQERNFQQESIQGEVYVSEEIAQFQLTPTQTGDLEIPSFKIRLAIPIDFFEERIVLLKTEPQIIHVKNLPPNAPRGFNGAVGDFTIRTQIDSSHLKVNNPITYELELIGEGNLSTIELPEIVVSPELEIYPPKRRNAFKKTLQGEKGKIVDAYVIVPQYGGKYQIPATSFTFFNPQIEAYQTIHTPAQPITVVGKSKNGSIAGVTLDSLKIKQDSTDTNLISKNVQNLNEQVKDYIKMPDTPTYDEVSSKSKYGYWLLGLPILALVCFMILKKRKKKLTPEQIQAQESLKAYIQQLKINIKTNLDKLEIAKNHQNLNDFTSTAGQILNQIVSLYANTPKDKVFTQSEASETLSNHVSERLLIQWETLHQKNQLMRYAGSISGESLADLYNEYEALVKDSLNKR